MGTKHTEDSFIIKKSTIHGAGKGLFAKVKISPHDTIGYYTGKILNDVQVDREPYVSSRYLMWVCKDHWIYGEGREANYTRFINHRSRNPNAELITSTRWKLARIAALRTIRPGQEIFFDYGEEYWEAIEEHPTT